MMSMVWNSWVNHLLWCSRHVGRAAESRSWKGDNCFASDITLALNAPKHHTDTQIIMQIFVFPPIISIVFWPSQQPSTRWPMKKLATCRSPALLWKPAWAEFLKEAAVQGSSQKLECCLLFCFYSFSLLSCLCREGQQCLWFHLCHVNW